MEKEPVFYTEYLDLFYEEKHIPRDIDMDVKQNKVTALIRPNGYRKSTFLHYLNRINDLTEGYHIDGAIEPNGVDVCGSKMNVVDLRTQMGVVFQKPNPLPTSIYDNITYGPKCQGIENRKILDAIVEQSSRKATPWEEVKDRLNDSAFDLSSGQQQCLCIARTIAMELEVTLMNEPTSALDPTMANKTENLMEKPERDHTIVIVTHSMQQAPRVSGYTILFLLDEVMEFNKTGRTFQQPYDKHVEDYVTGRFGQKEGPMIKTNKGLDTVGENALEMRQKVVHIHKKVVQILSSFNKEIGLGIVQSDDIVNHLEEEINDQTIRSLTLLSPVTSDLRRVVADIKIASELERIDDYAKNIPIFLIKHDDVDASILDYTQATERSFITMLQEVMTCYENRDINTAFEVPEKDKEINVLYKELKKKIRHDDFSCLMEHTFETSSILRNIERAGDHIKNICERIIYMMEGQHYDLGQVLRFA